jgi:luciferase-type oxidoreductase
MGETAPEFQSAHGNTNGSLDMLPKPTSGRLPLLITGGSQQDPDWLAKHGDGWMLYPRSADLQSQTIGAWRQRIKEAGRSNQPVMEPLYIDVTDDPDSPPQPIHLGLRLGVNRLRDYLRLRQEIGVNHIALNLRFNQADVEKTMHDLAKTIFPVLNE